MNDVEKLTDSQLVNLFQNPNIDIELKKTIINEIDRRDLEKIVPKNESIDFKTKIKILFTSYFFYKVHLKNSSHLLSEGNKKGYKQYWRFFLYGILFYTIVLFIAAKYFIKPYFFK